MERPWIAALLLGVSLVACQPTSSTPAVTEPAAAELLPIPAGEFLMGDPRGPASAQPQRLVYLDEYYIEATEVRADAYYAFLIAARLPAEPPLAPDLPAAGVPWKLAAAYCDSIGRRLPTEAEWEKAARGIDGRAYPWGDTWEARLANTAASSRGRPAAVDAYQEGASPWGTLNMAGNVAEWVADVFDPDYYSISPLRNPTGPLFTMDHVLRGGSWDSLPEQSTSYFRDSSHSVEPNARVGFRCAADAE